MILEFSCSSSSLFHEDIRDVFAVPDVPSWSPPSGPGQWEASGHLVPWFSRSPGPPRRTPAGIQGSVQPGRHGWWPARDPGGSDEEPEPRGPGSPPATQGHSPERQRAQPLPAGGPGGAVPAQAPPT